MDFCHTIRAETINYKKMVAWKKAERILRKLKYEIWNQYISMKIRGRIVFLNLIELMWIDLIIN